MTTRGKKTLKPTTRKTAKLLMLLLEPERAKRKALTHTHTQVIDGIKTTEGSLKLSAVWMEALRKPQT